MSEPEKTIKIKEPDISEAIYLAGRIKALGAFLNLANECDDNLNESTGALGGLIKDLADEVIAALDPSQE